MCDVTDPSCVDFVAEVVACQRDAPLVMPTVRFATREEVIAEREPRSEEQLALERDYWAGEALVGLMPQGYEPTDRAADALSGVLAYYDAYEDEIVMRSDADVEDEAEAYRILVHEFIHAHQDAEYDLVGLWETYATTFPRSLGLRAAVEGEAVLYTDLAYLELEGLPPDDILWNDYFGRWKLAMLERARLTAVPSLAVTGLFPYAFGGEQVNMAWRTGGDARVRDYVQSPPDSARQVFAGFGNRPPMEFNFDTELDPAAVPVLPGHTYLDGGAQDVWLLNTMFQRIAGRDELWVSEVEQIDADHLSVWRNDETGERVAVWRLMGPSDVIQAALTGPFSQWVEAADAATAHHMVAVDGDWVLVASESPNAAELAQSITAWQSRADALASVEHRRAPPQRRLTLPLRRQ